MSSLKYYYWSFLFTATCLVAAGVLGYSESGTVAGILSTLFICSVLGILEVSLSFDNALVNAKILKDMDEVWRRRFLTWGILIAVFGMRIVFPILIVAIAAQLGPIDAVTLAATQPDEYSRILHDAHTGIAAFGGTFLLMVGLKYFFDAEKDIHWIAVIERRLTAFGRIEAIEIGIALLLIYVFSRLTPPEEALTFIVAGIFGLLTYIAVEGLGSVFEASEETIETAKRSGLASFLYLEVLDASFSFDGVIGAFALSNNLFIIALGLGIGAMFVRSMTIHMVEMNTLSKFRYLEHGAFWAILALALIMFLQVYVHIPEVVTGLIGAALILLSLWSSIRYRSKEALARPVA